MTYEIDIPAKKLKDVLAILKALDVKIRKRNTPNSDTLKAMEELKSGKGVKFDTVTELFNSVK